MTLSETMLPYVQRADHIPGPPQGRWTYADYAALPNDGNRYEVINGVLYMAPAPIPLHQRTTVRFIHYLFVHVEEAGLGQVLSAPIDVELAPNMVLQPDVVVILKDNLAIVDEKKIAGIPDLVVEVASPSTAGYDRRQKQDEYFQAGVKEYWIADPYARTIEVLVIGQDAYQTAGVVAADALIPSKLLPGLPFPVKQLFP